MINEHDMVVLTVNVPEFGLVQGDIGFVLCIHSDGAAYEIEFCSADGHTIAMMTLPADKIRPRTAREILHVRTLVSQ